MSLSLDYPAFTVNSKFASSLNKLLVVNSRGGEAVRRTNVVFMTTIDNVAKHWHINKKYASGVIHKNW